MTDKELEDLKEEIETLNGYKHMYFKLIEENKRYREALLDAREELNTSLSMDVEAYQAVEIIDQALEKSR